MCDIWVFTWPIWAIQVTTRNPDCNLSRFRRKIVPSGMCELCGKEEETSCHLFWFCDHARGVWTSSKLVLPFELSPSWNFLDVVENLQRREESFPGLLEKVIMVCWSIWKNRNVLRLGGKGKAGHSLVRGALHLVDEFHEANVAKLENRVEAIAKVAWKPPRLGHYKVNTDGAVFSNRKQAGAGVIIRDGAGDVVAALSKKWNFPLGAIEAEAKALEAGVCFARDMGIWDVEFETDSLEIFNAVQGLTSPPSSVANVLAGFLLQASSLRQWCISHTKRQGNVPAHVLAQHSKSIEDFVTWVEDCPSFLEHVCAQDIVVPDISVV